MVYNYFVHFLHEFNGFIPTTKRTEVTNNFYKLFGYRTDYEIIGIT